MGMETSRRVPVIEGGKKKKKKKNGAEDPSMGGVILDLYMRTSTVNLIISTLVIKLGVSGT